MIADFTSREVLRPTVYRCSYSPNTFLARAQEQSHRMLPGEPIVDRLMKLKALALAATPGPWSVTRNETHNAIRREGKPNNSKVIARVFIPRDEDAQFIAACNPDEILKLLGNLEQLRAAVAVSEFLHELAKEV